MPKRIDMKGRGIVREILSLLALSVGIFSPPVLEAEGAISVSDLARRSLDSSIPWTERATAFSFLEARDVDVAKETARALLKDRNGALRSNAACFLADVGDPEGIPVLRAVAMDGVEYGVIAIKGLGRLHDPGSHNMLRAMLDEKLESTHAPDRAAYVSALSSALGDYADPADIEILSRVIAQKPGLEFPYLTEMISRSGDKSAVPRLREIFRHPPDLASQMMAGLGLARCRESEGREYLSGLLALDKSESASRGLPEGFEGLPEDQRRAHMSLFFRQLGSPGDTELLPLLLNILRSANHPYFASAWDSIPRLNPGAFEPQVLDLAWKNLKYDGAAKFVVQHDEPKARAYMTPSRQEIANGYPDTYERSVLGIALRASPLDRKRWKYTHGYTCQ